jgi:type I restriction enzyme S subunit
MSEEATLDEFANADGDDTTESATDTETLNQEQFGPFTLSTPGEWSAKRLSDIKRLITRGKQPTYDDDGIPVINQECIYWDGWHFENLRYLDENVGEDWKDKYFAQRGDIILNSTGQGTLGRAQVYPDNKRRAIDSHVTLIRTEDDLNPHFHRYFFESHLGQALLYSMCVNGSTGQIELSKTRLDLQPVPLPPLSEQRKIATVLYTVDRAIEKTEEIVEQVERTKQALTQSLFLNGYFDHRETVEAYHQNRLPRHPAEWQTKPAGEVMEVTRGAHPRPKSDDTLWRGEIPIVKIGDRNRGDSRTITSTDDTVTEKGSKKSKLVDQGTLIVSNAGTVGTARITGMQTCIHDHWLILRDYEENLSTRYLYYFINWNQEFLEALASGSTVLDLNTDDFRLFDITFPSLEEQQKIADTLDSLHNRKMVNVEYSDRLNRIKRGLMQDLVSGTVRTTDTNIEVPDEIAQYG